MTALTPTGARRGAQVLARLRERPPEVWHRGERIADPTSAPGIANGVQTLARLYDLQWSHPDVTLFDSPDIAAKVGRSFQIPKTADELKAVTRSMMHWTTTTLGMMGRLPDYINRSVSGYAAGAAVPQHFYPPRQLQPRALPPHVAGSDPVPDGARGRGDSG